MADDLEPPMALVGEQMPRRDGRIKRYYFATALLALVVFWIVLGAVVPYLMGRYLGTGTLPSAGQFGDMFGMVGALFSGAALLGLVYTIYLQQTDIEATGRSQAEQMKLQSDHIEKIAKSARIQALTFLASLQADWIDKAPIKTQAGLRDAANYYVDKAVALTKELGQDFGDALAPAGVKMFIPAERAEIEIFHIAYNLQNQMASVNKDTAVDGNARPLKYLSDASVALERWVATYRNYFDNTNIDRVLKYASALKQGNISHPRRNASNPKDYDQWWVWASNLAMEVMGTATRFVEKI